MSSAPAFLRLVPQRPGKSDCAVASLATLCGVDYEDALLVAHRVRPTVLSAGLFMRQIQAAGKRLGVALSIFRPGRYAIDEACGILHVWREEPPEESHAVILTGRGDIYDGRDNALWESDAYLAHHKYKAGYLLVRQQD